MGVLQANVVLRGYVSSRRRTLYDKRAHACSGDSVAEATSYAKDSAQAAILQDLVEQYSGQHSGTDCHNSTSSERGPCEQQKSPSSDIVCDLE
ncbi:hypothetical protein MTO96_041350 [Rhipicephalus appendiculatus]